MVEDDIGAQALAGVGSDVEEAVDHRQAVALLVRKTGAEQLSRPAVLRRLAIFDDIGANRSLLDHVGEIALVHFGHSAARMTNGEIPPQQLILFLGRPGFARAHLEIGVTAKQLALGRARLELEGEDPHGDAGRAIDAAWPISDRLTAAETDPAQCFVELARVAARELSEHFPFDLARKVRARARIRDEKLWEAERCAHPRPHSNGYEALYAAG